MRYSAFSLALAIAIAVGCTSDKTFVNVGTDANGGQHGVPKADVDKYAADHGISFQQAAAEIGAQTAGKK
jgi:hypothetical protein